MTAQVLRLVDNRTTVWVTAGHDGWRVTSADLSYGEWADIQHARAFLHLLIVGNPERYKGLDE